MYLMSHECNLIIGTLEMNTAKKLRNFIKMNPIEPVYWYNYGVYCHSIKKIDSAIKSYEKAIKLSRQRFREAEENMAQDLLLSGRWLEGWKYYETRLERMKNEMAIYYQLFGEPWKGMNDERQMNELIVVCEQGLGDTIQFIRILKILHSKGIKTKLLCQEAIKEYAK